MRKFMTTSLFSTILLSFLCVLSGCVSTSDYNRLRNQVYYQDQENKKQAERLAAMEQELQQRTQPIQSAQANNWAEISAMRSDIATVKGQIDDLQRAQTGPNGVTLQSLEARVQNMERTTQFIASQMGITLDEIPQAQKEHAAPTETTAAESFTKPSATPPTLPAKPAPTAPQSGSGQELYQSALEGFYAKKYAQAQVAWAEFVKGFPKDPLVPNAIFWQGECFFQLQDYANAVLTYQQVIEKHKKSNKYRPAMLKQGIAFIKLKKEKAGKLVLEDLIKRFPESPEAKRAKAYLQGIPS